MTQVRSRKFLLVSILGLGIAQPVAAQVAAPSNTSAVPKSESRIDVSWRDNSLNESGFELFRSASGAAGAFSLVARTGAGSTTLADVGLNPASQYCYKVRAVRTNGGRPRFSDFSNPACATTAAPPVQPGTVHIVTSTTGFDIDVNGYAVRLDQRADQPIGTNSYLTIPGVEAGDHVVALSGLASNCAVAGANPRAVNVVGGAVTDVLFSVNCGPGPAIDVTSVTTGENIDADGYAVSLWHRLAGSRTLAASAALAANSNVRFFGLNPGEYELEVSGVAANCTQVNTLPLVDVSSGGAVSLALNVSCAPIIVTCSAEICDNGNDDDCDGLVDGLDPDCQGACIDCGFNLCPPGYICGYDGCCISHCGDGEWNGTEGDVDCGGHCAQKCQTGQHCWSSSDCASGFCSFDRCQ